MLLKKIRLILAAILLFAFSGCSSLDTVYYSKIDNEKMNEIEPETGIIKLNGGMSYEYKLEAYQSNGKEAEVTFGTDHELIQDRYIKLVARPIQGVVSWEEVSYEDLPEKVQEIYKE